MTYAGDRVLYDADTHIMELPDFLRKFADPDIREELPLGDGGAVGFDGFDCGHRAPLASRRTCESAAISTELPRAA